MIFKGRRFGEAYDLKIDLRNCPGLVFDVEQTDKGARFVVMATVELTRQEANSLLAVLKDQASRRYPPQDRVDPWECRRQIPGGGAVYARDLEERMLKARMTAKEWDHYQKEGNPYDRANATSRIRHQGAGVDAPGPQARVPQPEQAEVPDEERMGFCEPLPPDALPPEDSFPYPW